MPTWVCFIPNKKQTYTLDSGESKLYAVNLASETDKVSDEIGFRTIRTEGHQDIAE